MVARGYEYDVARTAAHLVMREELVRVAMKYAGDFQDEISGELAEFDEIDYEALQRILPNIHSTIVPDAFEIEPKATEAV